MRFCSPPFLPPPPFGCSLAIYIYTYIYMDRYRCGPGLSDRFGSHLVHKNFSGKSVRTNPLVPCFQGKSVWTNGPESSSSLPRDWHWSMDGSSQRRSQSNSRNGTHDLIYVKTLSSDQRSERLSELVGPRGPTSDTFHIVDTCSDRIAKLLVLVF